MGRIDNETVRRILDTADIVDVVSDFVNLKKSGANYIGLCPFHNERTPSFSVSKSRNYCKCFSCGKGGSPVGFIMEHENLSYAEALRWLAKKYNIEIKERELTDEERQQASERESMLALNEFALDFFTHTIQDTPQGRAIGLSYFRQRGLTDASIHKFRLGFAPEQRDAFASLALKQGFTPELLKATGLCSMSDRGTLYDRFRGRVIYPIFGLSGKVLGFGGRTLKTSKEVAKYVNSPESIIYHKSDQLYGLLQARRAIVAADKCILVEGYMDVISMSQRGVENVVASSGTSLTHGQINLIHRFTNNVTVIYDADPAGIKASIRGIDMLLEQGINIKVMLLPPGEDPDSFAKAHTLDEIHRYMAEHETDFIRFKANVMMGDMARQDDPVARANVISSMAKSISVIPDNVLRSEYVKECAHLLQTSEELVALQVAKYRNEALDTRLPAKTPPDTIPTQPKPVEIQGSQAAYLRPSEMELCRLLARYGCVRLGTVVGPDGEPQSLSVSDYIFGEMQRDDITLSNPDLNGLYDAAADIIAHQWTDEQQRLHALAQTAADELRQSMTAQLAARRLTMAEMGKAGEDINVQADALYERTMNDGAEIFMGRRLSEMSDPTVRSLANSLISEKYILSRIHSKGQKIETERDLLPVRVPKAVHGLKISILQWREKSLRATLAQTQDNELAQQLLHQLQDMRVIISDLAKYLGERIILPR